MKKILSLTVCAVLTVAVLLSFAGCNNTTKAKTKKSEEPATIIGTWSDPVDITESVKSALDAVNPNMQDYFEIKDVHAVITYTFNEDGTYKRTIDKEKLQKQFDALLKKVPDANRKFLEFIIKGHGLNTTPEQYCLDQSQMTFDEVAEDFKKKFETHLKELLNDKEGHYEFDGEHLNLYVEAGQSAANNIYTVKLEKETLTFVSYTGVKDGAFTVEGMLPATYKKVK